MPNSPARDLDSKKLAPRLAAVEWQVPSSEPDTSELDNSWFHEGPRHSFIAFTGTRNEGRPARRGLSQPGPVQELAYDLCDSPHALVILVDLPGVHADHVSLTLGSNALYLKVSVPAEDEPRLGVPAGDYEVRVETPVNVGPDAFDASMKHGLLRIRISKSPAGARRVTIVSDDRSAG